MLVLFSTVFLFGQATVTDIFKSDVPLVVSKLAISSKEPTQFGFTEITFDMSGKWSNALDPNQIDASANLIGPADNYAIINAFLNQEFKSSLENGVEKLIPVGTTNWVMRFAPWAAGSFGVFFQFADSASKIAPPSLKFKVSKSNVDAFTLGGDLFPYLRFGKTFLFVVGNTMPKLVPGGSLSAQMEFEKIGSGGVARLVMDRSHFGINYVEPEEIAFRPDLSMLRSAWLNDAVIQSASRANVKLILSIGSKSDLDLASGWQSSLFNSKNGGPCGTPDEFFTNLRARIMIKRSLRYFIARIQAFPNIIGIELFPGVNVPSYWLQEMEAEIIGLHIYGLPVTTLPTSAESAKLKTRGYVSQYIGKSNSAIGFVNSCIEQVGAMRKVCNYPVMLNSDEPIGDYAQIAPWAALISGSAGIIAPNAFSNKSVSQFFKRFDWAKRKLILTSVETTENATGWARADDKGGMLFLISKSGSAGFASMALQKPGKYRVEWVDCVTGEMVSMEDVKTEGNLLKLNYPGVKECIAAEFKRL